MDKLIILIWFWFIVVGSPINPFTKNTENNQAYIINENTVSANSTNSYTWEDSFYYQDDSVKSCVECHDKYLKGEVVHSPAKKDCNRCHISKGNEHPNENISGFNLKKEVPGLCYECHDPKNEEEFVHEPAQKGKCLTCHDPHNSPNIYLVKENPVSKLCLDCHDLKIPEGNLIHGAVSDGDCQGCHNPHQANNKSFIANTKLDRLCKSCHKSIRKELKKEHVHDPFKKKNCFDCHKPHSSKEAHLSDLKTKDLCFSCHEEVHNTIENASLVHGAINEAETCLNCHSPHSSAEEKILKTTENELCLECHAKEISSDSGNIHAIGPLLKEGNTIHGAIKEEGCTACHKPHTSEEHSLLNKTFPFEKYVKATVDNFSLCFSCHDKELIESPVTKTATNFRDGNQNLHNVHIQNERGRNCTLCHDVHGTENSYMIKQKTKYGNWEMPIEFEYSDKGGSCLTGCHTRRSYERIVLKDTLNQKK